MEITLLVIVLILVLIGNNRFNAVKEAVNLQHSIISQLRADLLAFQKELRSGATPPPVSEQPVTIITEQELVAEPMPPISSPVSETEPEPVLMESISPVAEPEPVHAPAPQPMIPAPPKPSYFQRFLAENPDLEKFIGENLINKIGIIILVAGIGYFVKFAIDQNWINEIGRVLIGVLAGGLLLVLAHRLRTTFTAFSSVLVAGGLSVLYFTIAIAFSDYKIFSQTAAFLLMVVITGFAILLSIAYNRVALAVMSLIGGFSTPFMVSTGEGNYIVLFSYLLILDSGMLILAYFKKWHLVHWVAYGFTILLYGTWLGTEVLNTPQPPYAGALLFATGFYVVFMAMNLIYNLKNQLKFSAIEITLLLSNTAFYFAAGMLVLAKVNQGAWQGLFTAGLAVVNFGIAVLLYRRQAVDRTLIYLLIGLVITFISLTIPVQLDGNFITMFWALEAVLLLWLAQRSGLHLLAAGSVLVLGLMLISLVMDWSDLYITGLIPSLPLILNKAFVTSTIAIVGLILTFRLLRSQQAPFQFWIGQLTVPVYRRIVGYLMVIVAYFAGYNEVDYQATVAYGYGANSTIIQGAYQLTFTLVLLLIIRRYAVRSWLIQAIIFSVFVILFYITLFDPALHELLQAYFTGNEPAIAGFYIHYVSLAGMVGLLLLLPALKPALEPLSPFIRQAWPWFLGFIVVYTASSELFSHVVYFQFSGSSVPSLPGQKAIFSARYDALTEQIAKVGLPILWGVCAFAFMYTGLTRRNRQFRILSLSLFALTLVKLFFYDLEGISEGGRIAAFISLGALLLIISFMYQRIKRLILDNNTLPPATDEL
ncbi:DUF2339 domain-containing protein [Spirosoma spitsbergense]|uniref:DUF2339 domain-containing protein n=1 Tax=Spirosoma spitsbergense TaxID=431554 RepID=UPI00037850A5|nr:DUF2339 domain-containing protein [Spirosoma spitsbergense]